MDISRYHVIEEIGRGGMGIVYRARDTVLGREVALKLISDTVAGNPSFLERFKREARAASAINDPGVCAIYDIDLHEDRPFLVMEYVKGRTLYTLIGEPLAEDRLRRLGAEIAAGLSVAHAAGIVHRDIKPANIMVTERGRAKILDFGLAKLAPVTGLTSQNAETLSEASVLSGRTALLGTIRYMSPEQIKDEPVGPKSDVFSLGTVLYQIATGHHPFEADDAVGVLNATARQAPLAPSTVAPGVSRNLETLILQMLEKDPRLRPTSGEVAERLRRIAGTKLPRSEAARPSRHTVGRVAERRVLLEGLKSVESGRGMLVCIVGEAGMGKSTLVEDLFDGLADAESNCTRARGRCLERLVEGGGFLPFLDAFESLLRSDGGGTAERLMRLLAPTWHRHIVPLSAHEHALRTQFADSQERIKRELFGFLRELTRHRPLVLFLDDLQWADASTIDLLAFLGGRLDQLPVLLVAAYRPSELLLVDHPFLRVQLDLQSRGYCREVPLQFLTLEDTRHYLALEFPGHRFPEAFPTLIHTRTEGSPLFTVDLLRYLRSRREIIQDHGRWTLVHPLAEVARELPPSTQSMIQRKIGLLTAEERQLLVTASVQGTEFESAVLARVMDGDPAGVEESLDNLARRHRFLQPLGEREFGDGQFSMRYGFVHVLYQQAFHASLQPTRRSQLSASVAKALSHLYGDRRQEVANELALLFETGRDYRCAAEYFRLASEKNAHLFACEEAAGLARRGLAALEHVTSTPERTQSELQLQLVLGPALMAMKGFASPEVQKTYARARTLCEQIGETSEKFPALWGLWQYYVMRADLASAHELAQQVHALANSRDDADLLLEAHRALGETAHWRGHMEAAQPPLERVIEVYDADRHGAHAALYGLDPAVASLCILGWTLWTRGYPDRALERTRQCIDLSRKLSHPFSLAFACFAAAGVHLFRREALPALELADEAIQLSIERGYPFWLGTSSCARGWALGQLGRDEEAVAQLRSAVNIYRATGAEMALPWFHFILAGVLRRTGNAGEAQRLLAEARSYLEKNGDRWWEPELGRVQGQVLLAHASDGETKAESCFRRSIQVARAQGARSWELRSGVSLARLLARQARCAEARQVLEPIYAEFTEGYGTGDLRDARSLLAELS